MTKVLETSCHRGAVHVRIAHVPEFINDCDCTFCRNSGAIWGYFDPTHVAIKGETTGYVRADREAPVVEIHSCKTCSATTHWQLSQAHQLANGPAERMGVNMHLFDRADLIGVELRFPDGRGWDGTPGYDYRKPSVLIDENEL